MDYFVEQFRRRNHRQYTFILVYIAFLITVLILVFYTIKSDVSSMKSGGYIKTQDKSLHLLSNCTATPANVYTYGFKGEAVQCNNLSLQRVPEPLPNHTFVLDLSNNFIFSLIQCQFCQTPFLQYLDLSYNNLTVLDMKSFERLPHLLFMDLSNNKLEETVFQNELFQPLNNLKTLRINKCNYMKYPDQSLGKLYNLESLTLDGLSGHVLGEGFRNLTQLRYLSMSGWESRCSIKNLRKTMFYNTPYLKYLNISRCDISYVDDAALSPLKDIFVFNMSDNHGLKLMKNICSGLRNTSIEVAILDRMEPIYGHAFVIKSVHVKFCMALNLRLVSLQQNKIDYIEVKAAKLLPKSLEILYVTDNRFSIENYFHNETDVWDIVFPCLWKIFNGHILNSHHYKLVGYNKYDNMHKADVFAEIKDLRSRPTCLKPKPKSHHEHLAKKELNGDINFAFPKTLQEIHVNGLFLDYYVPEITLRPDNHLMTIHVMGNHLYDWIGPIHNAGSLKNLDIGVNYCSNVSTKFFSSMSSLERLNLRMNYLGDNLSSDEDGEIFAGLNSLKYLNLHLNRITSMPRKIFKSLNRLEHLDLSYNSLSEFNVNISHITNLSYINLCNNAIESIPEITRNHLDTIAINKNVTLHLSNNEIKCTCSNIGFLKWVNNSDILFPNKDYLICRDQNWFQTNFTHLDHVIKSLEESCEDWSGLITGISVALGILVLTIIIAALYRKRWTLKYIYYTTLGRYRLIHEEQKDTGYKYDAFVSYDSSDRTFVIEKMLHYLEKQGDLNLCIHERDFTPGNAIAANIVDSIRDSRKTVCVMSSEFLQSKWCMFEFNMAKMESMFTRGGRPVHYLVLLDSFNSRDLPLEVLDVIESQSYIEYPNDEFGNILFWDKVRETLKGSNQMKET